MAQLMHQYATSDVHRCGVHPRRHHDGCDAVLGKSGLRGVGHTVRKMAAALSQPGRIGLCARRGATCTYAIAYSIVADNVNASEPSSKSTGVVLVADNCTAIMLPATLCWSCKALAPL
jgi:hypothetical protein